MKSFVAAIIAAVAATAVTAAAPGGMADLMADMQYIQEGTNIYMERVQKASMDAMMRAQSIPQKDL